MKINLEDVSLVTGLNKKEIKYLISKGLTKREIFSLKDTLNSWIVVCNTEYRSLIEYAKVNEINIYEALEKSNSLPKSFRKRLKSNSSLKISGNVGKPKEIFGYWNGEKYSISDLSLISGLSYQAILKRLEKTKGNALSAVR